MLRAVAECSVVVAKYCSIFQMRVKISSPRPGVCNVFLIVAHSTRKDIGVGQSL